MGDEGSRKITKNTHDKFSVEQDGSFKMIPKRADKKDMKAWKKKRKGQVVTVECWGVKGLGSNQSG